MWVAPGAILIRDVTIGNGSSIWFNCVLRADVNSISIGRGSNIQDGSIIHVDPGPLFTRIGDGVTVGHGCILHGCKLGDRALVGMGATVFLTMRPSSLTACWRPARCSLPGKIIRSGELWAGAPARFSRNLREQELLETRRNAEHYVRNAMRFRSLLRPAQES